MENALIDGNHNASLLAEDVDNPKETQRLKSKGGALLIAAGPSASSLGDGVKDVSTAGTAERLVAASTSCKWVIIVAKCGNTGKVYVGASTVDAGNERGAPLDPGDSIRLDVEDLHEVWLDVENNGDGVSFIYGKE